jgi:hypothetical protein
MVSLYDSQGFLNPLGDSFTQCSPLTLGVGGAGETKMAPPMLAVIAVVDKYFKDELASLDGLNSILSAQRSHEENQILYPSPNPEADQSGGKAR